MRTPEELHHAIRTLGSSFVLDGDLRRYLWEDYPDDLQLAKGMFFALCWMVGTDESGIERILSYVTLKAAQYTAQQKEKTHAG